MAEEPGTRKNGGDLGRSKLVRQILVLGLALVLTGVTLALPWRNNVDAGKTETAAIEQQHQLEQQKRMLELKKAALADPNYIKAEAKRRLQYVEPGSTVYVFRGPELPPEKPVLPEEAQLEQPWYSALWDSLSTTEDDDR